MPVRLGIMMVIILQRCNLISPEIFRGNFSLSTLNFICETISIWTSAPWMVGKRNARQKGQVTNYHHLSCGGGE